MAPEKRDPWVGAIVATDDPTRTSILLVEDHPVIRIGLRTIIESQPDLEVVGEATSMVTALEMSQQYRPDLVLLPMRLEGELKGMELCRDLVASPHGPRVVIYTSFNAPSDASMAFLSGAHSFIHKTEEVGRIIETIRATMQGRRIWLLGSDQRFGMEDFDSRVDRTALTQREREVLGLMLHGLTNAQVATKLYIELPTVKTHVRNILSKLGVQNRRELLRRDLIV